MVEGREMMIGDHIVIKEVIAALDLGLIHHQEDVVDHLLHRQVHHAQEDPMHRLLVSRLHPLHEIIEDPTLWRKKGNHLEQLHHRMLSHHRISDQVEVKESEEDPKVDLDPLVDEAVVMVGTSEDDVQEVHPLHLPHLLPLVPPGLQNHPIPVKK